MTGIAGYAVRRLGRGVIVVVGITIVTFFLTHIAFNPVDLILPDTASPAERKTFEHQLGLDKPLLTQFWDYIVNLLHGDFGTSLTQHTGTLSLVLGKLPASLILASTAMVVAVVLGLGIGIVAGTRPGTWLDRIVSGFGALGLSIPDFWFGIMLILIFAAHLRLLPTSGFNGPESLILPAFTLCLRPAGRLAAVSRESIVAEMRKPYVVNARSRGLTTSQIVFRHVLKNVAVACTTIIGYDFLFMFTGYAVGVEIVFNWPGVGRMAVQATLDQDVTLLSTIVIVTGALIALGNAVIDTLHAIIDRRISM
jgi:peptide/nickel transport system permease protein